MKETAKHSGASALLGLLSIFILVRLLPLFWHSINLFGYDYGLYAYAAKHVTLSGWENVLVGVFGGYSHPLFYVLKVLDIPPTAGLNALHFLVSIAIGAAFYFVYPKNRAASLWAVLLAALSIPQAEGYLLFLFKNEVGLVLLLLSFGFVLRKQYWYSGLTAFLLLFSHRTSIVVYVCTMALYVAYVQAITRKWLWLAGEGLLACLFVLGTRSWWTPKLQVFISNPNRAVYEGVFLYGQSFLAAAWPVLLLALVGTYLYVRQKQHALLLAFLFVTAAWVVFRLPFYNRMLLYLDVALILFAAYALALVNFRKRQMYALACVLLLLIATYKVILFNVRYQPLITQAEIQEIEEYKFPPGSFVVALSGNDAPWLLGYLPEGVRLAAPGLFEDRHSYNDWLAFWDNEQGAEFLSALPRPLFVYHRSYEVPEAVRSCTNDVSRNFVEVVCP